MNAPHTDGAAHLGEIMNRTTTTRGFIAGAFACIALTACDSGDTRSAASAAASILDQLSAGQPSANSTGLPKLAEGQNVGLENSQDSDDSADQGRTGQPNGDGSGNQDGSGPGNQDGSGPGNQDGNGPGNQDGTGGGNQDGTGGGNQDGTGGGNQDGTGGGNQDGTGGGNGGGNGGGGGGGNGPGGGDGGSDDSDPTSDPTDDPTSSDPAWSDGIPSIDYAEVTCLEEADGTWMPYLSFTVSDTTGLDVNLNASGLEGEGGYHNYETSYDGLTGTVPMPYTGCYAEYGESIYRLTVQGHYDDNDLTEEQFELGEKTIAMTGEYHDENAPVPAPRIDEYVLSCTYLEDSGTYDMSLYYSVANADGMALSIDNPGIVGSFGEYGPSGTIDIPDNGCYAENGEQTYDLYTIGGVGDQAVVNLTRTGEYSYATPATTPTDEVTPTTVSPIPTPGYDPNAEDGISVTDIIEVLPTDLDLPTYEIETLDVPSFEVLELDPSLNGS